MALNIGNKVFRNLPDQVAFLTSELEKLAEIVDGISLEDKLIVINNSSGMLNSQEMEVASKEVAFIYNSSIKRVYYKASSDSSYNFRSVEIQLPSTIGGGYSLKQESVVVSIATGAFNTINSVNQTFYSKSEIDFLLSLKADITYVDAQILAGLATKANLTGASFTGPVSATKLSQSEANYAVEFNFNSSTSSLEITNVYNKFEVINNVLYVIVNIKLKNVSGTSYRFGGSWGNAPFVALYGIPSEIGSQIIDLNGDSVASSGTNSRIITSVPIVCTTNTITTNSMTTYNDWRIDMTNRSDQNSCAFYIFSNNDITIADQAEVCMMGRMALTLI